MKDYLINRTAKEFEELDTVYAELFSKWTEAWDNPEIHDKLYSCYVRLKIVAVLLRSCLKYNFIENVNLRTKETNVVSLKDFCDYCIHHSHCVYEDNRNSGKDLEIYLVIDTDRKKEIAFIVNKNIKLIREAVQEMKRVLHNY